MKVFVCCRSVDRIDAERIIEDLLSISENSIAILQEPDHSQNWQDRVTKKMKESDFVLFILGADTFQSQPMIWEYAEAKRLNKPISGFKLAQANQSSILYCQGFQVFNHVDHCFKFICKTYQDDRDLKLEQYRMMFESTQKVTEQRLTVNNLFFTLTATIFSIGFIVGKTFEFSITGMGGMIISNGLAYTVTFYWEKLVGSYGKLNTGKFKVIDNIEKKLRTNMFEEEWNILIREVNYEANTLTEQKIVKHFRIVILLTGIIEFLYFLFISFKAIKGESLIVSAFKLLFINHSCNC
jgi:hypothetical protein